jgi:hypothetical protein
MNARQLHEVGDAICHLIDFVGRGQRHVTRSTYSSELFACTDSVDAGLVHSLALREFQRGPLTAEAAKLNRESQTKCGVRICVKKA